MPAIDRIPGMPTRLRRALEGIGSDFVPYTGAIKNVDLGTYNLTTTGTIAGGTLTDGILSITGGNLSTTGLGTFGNLDVDTLNLNANVISDSTGTISFDNENLTTTGTGTLGELIVATDLIVTDSGNDLVSIYGDIKTDRWLEHDTNTFLGIDVAGADALSNTAGNEGYQNTAMGCQSLYSNTTGQQNNAIGYQALYDNTEGTSNNAMGRSALYSNTTGSQNNATGALALFTNTIGVDNNATGYAALLANIDGNNNNATGSGSLRDNTEGDSNNAMGYQSLRRNTTGNRNSAEGTQALYSNTEGSNNTALGFRALYSTTTGANNIGMGAFAGFYQTTESNQFFVDSLLRADAATELTNAILYGIMAAAQADQKLYVNAACDIGDQTNYAAFAADGSLTFVGTAALPYGYCHGDHIAWTQVNAVQNTWYTIADADMASGALHDVTHDGNGLLTVGPAGKYLVTLDASYEVDAANKHIEFGVEVDGAAPATDSPHVHTTSKFANQEQHNSATGIIVLTAGQTIQVAMRTIDAGIPDFVVDNIHLSCVQVGGT